MSDSVSHLKHDLETQLATLVWDQWVAIGGAGSARESTIPFAIDIEALILATTRFGTDDPRILDVAYDWLFRNGALVNLQRIKNIQRKLEFGDGNILRQIARSLSLEKHHNWKSMVKAFPASQETVEEETRRYHSRDLSIEPAVHSPDCFLLRLRSLFGVNARVEVFTWLLTHQHGYAAQIARDCYWLPKTVQVTLQEMALGNFVSLRPTVYERREKDYEIPRPEKWRDLLHIQGNLQWNTQPAVYAGCGKILALLDQLADIENSADRVKGMHVRNAIPEIAVTIADGGFEECFLTWKEYSDGEALLEFFLERCRTLTTLLGTRSFKTSN